MKTKDSAAEYFDRMECMPLHLFVFVWGLFSYPFILGNISFFSLLRFFKNFIYHCWIYKVLTQISPRVNSPHACNSQIHDFYFNFCIVLHTSQINDFCFNFFIFIYMSISCSVHLTLLSHVVFGWPLGMGNLSGGSSLKINSPSLSNYYFLQILN